MVSSKISRKNSPKFRRWGETSHPATGRRALAGAWDRPAALGAAAPGASPVGFMALGVPHHWLFIVYYVRNKLEALPLMLDDFSIPYFESYEWVLMRIKSTISEKNAGNCCGRKQTYSYSQKMKLQDDFCFGTSNWWFFEADGLEVILEDWEGSELQRMHYWKICKDYMAWTEFPGAGK